MKTSRYLISALVIITTVGCSTKGKEKPGENLDETRGNVPIYNTGDSTGVGSDGSGTGSNTTRMGGVPSERVIYFDFDRSEVRADQQGIVAGHGNYLAASPNMRIRVEGHADERGSREYNLALGERRAETVKRSLMALGAIDTQMTTLSYGEEKPLSLEHNEAAWQLNRRAELVYP
ncbi:MAG: peptidoglycan-associated lipoprotein [Beggiatoa sp. IS2]|nr:MAG: peptidoglycan-associated lipoprotein [Beggiatoa sp. IS2]